MESFFGKYKNPLVLMAVLFIQIIALATQVKKPSDLKAPNSPSTRLIRVWTVTAFAPLERAFVGTGHFFRNGWHNYIDLHDVRKQNQDLQAEVTRLRMEQVRLREDAGQAQRLQLLLGFRERFISQTTASQVIGTSGSQQSQVIYIDKGTHDGIKADMAVITPDGIVGKIKEALPLSSQVLMINDRDSGAGAILEQSRLQGVLRGTAAGELQLDGIMADQPVKVGDQVIASGGDRIYPKGFPVGTVSSVAPDRDTGTFLTIKIKPAADLNRLEEVLVVTKMAEQATTSAEAGANMRAADILAQRLPGIPKTDPTPSPITGEDEKKKVKPAAKNPTGENTGAVVKTPADPDTAGNSKPKKPVVQSGEPNAPKARTGNTPKNQSPEEKKALPQQPPGTQENPRQ